MKRMKLTRLRLNRLIKEESAKLLSEQEGRDMRAVDDELDQLGSYISDLNQMAGQVTVLMEEMAGRYGELSATTTYAVRTANAAAEVSRRFNAALAEMQRSY